MIAPWQTFAYASGMADGPVEVLERLIRAGVAITSRALTDAMPALELTFPQWRVLLVVGDGDRGATVSEVSARVGVTIPATSRQLRRLARRGLVEIYRDEHDRRAARARLTARGSAALEGILRYRKKAIADIADGLTLADATLRDLDRVTDGLAVYR